jgi:hypothetical protein
MISSCDKSLQNIKEGFQKLISSNLELVSKNVNSKKVILIIPRTGCSGCIGVADHFFKNNNYNTEDVLFIFTKISSAKTIRLRLGKERVESTNVIEDHDNQFSQGILDSIYPIILFMEGGEIQEIEFLSPDKKDLITKIQTELALV